MKTVFYILTLALCVSQQAQFQQALSQQTSTQVDARWKPNDPDRPVPPVIEPGTASTQDAPGRPPSDAVVLFDGKDLSQWAGADGQPAKWKVADGYMEVVPHSGLIKRASLSGTASCTLSSPSLCLRLAKVRNAAIVACS